jgi:hypothetical protein
VAGRVSNSALSRDCVQTLKMTLHTLALHCSVADSPAMIVTSRDNTSLLASFVLLSSQ